MRTYMLFTGWEVCFGRNCARGLLMFLLLRFKSFRKILLQHPTLLGVEEGRVRVEGARSIAKKTLTCDLFSFILSQLSSL